jgi:hypothetical protein
MTATNGCATDYVAIAEIKVEGTPSSCPTKTVADKIL